MNMTVLLLCPGKRPEVITFPHELEQMQQLVGGRIEAIYAYLEKCTQQKLDLKQDDSTLIFWGKRLLIFFPGILQLVPCKTGNNEPGRFQPIESRMCALKRDPELFKFLQYKASLLDHADSAPALTKKERHAAGILKQVTDSYLWDLGNLLCTHFPEVCNIDLLDSGAGLVDRFWPVDSILWVLSEDHVILDQIAKTSNCISVAVAVDRPI